MELQNQTMYITVEVEVEVEIHKTSIFCYHVNEFKAMSVLNQKANYYCIFSNIEHGETIRKKIVEQLFP